MEGSSVIHNLGDFESYSQAVEVIYPYLREELKKSDKELPPKISWTTSRAFVAQERTAQSRSKNSVSAVATLIGFVAIAMALPFWRTATAPAVSPTSGIDIKRLSTEIAGTKQEVESLKAIIQGSPSGTKELGTLTSDVDALKTRLNVFEAALGDNLDRRLAVPMLRKDLDAVKEQYRVDLAAVDARLTLVVDLMKWLLGIIGVGGVLSGLSSWFAKPKPVQEKTS
jgi:hypothetical protein